jgi:hypothetical protein
MPSIRVVVQKEDMEDMDVCFWHKADMLNALTNVGFWVESGHDADGPLCQLMTQSGRGLCPLSVLLRLQSQASQALPTRLPDKAARSSPPNCKGCAQSDAAGRYRQNLLWSEFQS